MKPGVKTSEFWLVAAANVLPLLLASGLLAETSVVFKIATAVVGGLSALGYIAGRTYIKTHGDHSIRVPIVGKAK